MSADTLTAIHEAIAAHYRDTFGSTAVITDWVIGYGGMMSDSDSSSGIAYPTGYATSDGSPYATLGVAHLTLENLTNDLAYSDDD